MVTAKLHLCIYKAVRSRIWPPIEMRAMKVHQLVEFPDNVGPTFKEGFINYGTGELIIEAHKTMDLTPASKVNMSGLYLSNLEDDPIENGVSLEEPILLALTGCF